MKFCKRCLYTSLHPLHLTFDAEGVCSGCRVHEEKDQLDWKERAEKLKKILDSYRCRSHKNYDCVVPVSGARDSYFIVHMVKNVFGMNPLLVSYNKQYNTETGIRNLANLRIKFNSDIMTMTVNPVTVKKITRATLRRMGSIYWHCIAGQTVFPVQIATRMKIPLIIWGAHQGVDQVGMYSHLDEVEMTRKYRKEHDLMGYEAEDLICEEDAIREQDVSPYAYPSDLSLDSAGVRGIYLNNYIRWDSKSQHEQMIKLYDFWTAPQTRTFDTYNDNDCYVYSDLHDYIKYLKHGYGKVTDQACRDIRLGHLTREEGIQVVNRFTQRAPQFAKLFLNWIGMNESGFQFILNQHRNPHFWKRNENWQWELKTPGSLPNSDSTKDSQYKFILTPNEKQIGKSENYILYGKGHPDYPDYTSQVEEKPCRLRA